jgi:hypothetical protein
MAYKPFLKNGSAPKMKLIKPSKKYSHSLMSGACPTLGIESALPLMETRLHKGQGVYDKSHFFYHKILSFYALQKAHPKSVLF